MGRKPIEKDRIANETKKEKWIKAIIPIFKENGIKSITMDELAIKIGISKATIYNHFTSRDQIIEEGVLYKLNKLKEFEVILNDTSLGYVERYYEAMKYYITQLTDISKIMLEDIKELFPQIWMGIGIYQNHSSELLERYYNQGVDKGYFHDIDVNILVLTDVMFIEALSNDDYIYKFKVDHLDGFDAFFKMKFEGLVKSKIIL